MTTEWVAEHIAPNVRAVYGEKLAGVLGCALVWLSFSDKKDWVPNPLWVRIVDAVQGNRQTPDDTNPIRKRSQVVTGRDAVVHMESISLESEEENNGEGQNGQNDTNQPRIVTPDNHRRGRTTTDCLLQTVMANQNKQQRALNNMQSSIADIQGQLRGNQCSFNRLT